MNGKTFAFDLGTGSVGWAVVEDKEIRDAGVSIFTEGVAKLGEGDSEQARNAKRREKRLERRQFFRRRLRKGFLLKALVRFQMVPLSEDELKKSEKRKESHAQLLASENMQTWLKLNPYVLRKKALEENITRLELGRIFYHFIQRRGFLSNSKKAQGAEDKKTIDKGKPKEGKVGIDATYELIESTQSTLGAALHSIYPEEGKSYRDPKKGRIRNRNTTREMYTNEFDRIWEAQAGHLGLNKETYLLTHKRVLAGAPTNIRNKRKIERLNSLGVDCTLKPSEIKRKDGSKRRVHRLEVRSEVSLKELLGDKRSGRLFYQRPLCSQKGRVGRCTFERGKYRCPTSHPLDEERTVYEFVNTIRPEERALTPEEREQAVRFLLQYKSPPKFKTLAEKIGIDPKTCKYPADHTCPHGRTISQLAGKGVFGMAWFAFSEAEREDIWHTLYCFDEIDKIEKYAQTPSDNGKPKLLKDGKPRTWKLDPEAAKQFTKVRLKDGYSNLSRKAIRNILPFLKEGHVYSSATPLAGVRTAFGVQWETLPDKKSICDKVSDIVSSKERGEGGGDYRQRLERFLSNEYALSKKALRRLYHHSTKQVETLQAQWPSDPKADADREIQELRNPVVICTLFELRKVFNALIKEYGKPERVKIELARDLKKKPTAPRSR